MFSRIMPDPLLAVLANSEAAQNKESCAVKQIIPAEDEEAVQIIPAEVEEEQPTVTLPPLDVVF
jgi:hypothetical protein